uniref:DNA-directed RNA polymerase subunit n=2 Tax=Lacertinae TaxID=162266 RepID=A0A670J0C0_PODMU|nr:DNA-directed RNA polymerase III subunit RPC8 [Podarcis muralis]
MRARNKAPSVKSKTAFSSSKRLRRVVKRRCPVFCVRSRLPATLRFLIEGALTLPLPSDSWSPWSRDREAGTLLLLATMFVLVEMTDTVRIPPWQFERKLNDAITEELNKKLANKVVYNVGLCICLYDITKLEDSYIFPGDGASHTKVHFRYVVFHPFLDEILVGVIKGCSLEGVRVSLGFFDDIIIPPESLQQPAKFDEAEQVWVWEYETEEGAHDLYMDTGEEIRFRVVDETFIDTSPTGPSSAEPSTSSATEEVQKKEAPYTLVGSISEPGLGLLSWWTNS